MPATFVLNLRSIPGDVKPSAAIKREIRQLPAESRALVRQVASESSGLGAVRWFASLHGNEASPEQHFGCIRRTCAGEPCPCPLFAGWGEHLEAQSAFHAPTVPAAKLKLKSRAVINRTAFFFITGSDDPDDTLLFWYSIIATLISQGNF